MKRFENNLLELIPTREKCIEHYLTEVVTTISDNLVKYNNKIIKYKCIRISK